MKYIFKKATSFIGSCFNYAVLYCIVLAILTGLNSAYKSYQLGKQFKNCQEYKEYLQEQIAYKRELKSKCLNKCSEECNNEANKPFDKEEKSKLLECNLKKLAKTKI
jgi:hypothetical protein